MAGKLSLRVRQVGLLLPATARAGRWLPVLPAAALGLLAIHHTAGPAQAGFVGLRVAAVALALGSAFVLDDPAAELLACSPTPLWVRRLPRVGLLLALLGIVWAGLLGRVGLTVLPVAALTLELVALVCVTLAIAAWAAPHTSGGLGGLAAGPGLLALLPVAFQAQLWAGSPGDPLWALAHRRWLVTLAASVVLLVWASLDPARWPLHARLRRCLRPLADATCTPRTR